MAITNPDYSVGTVSITTGTKVLTGVNTMWLSADLEKGDQFGFDGYSPARIETINNDGSITLLDTWRGPTLAASPYFIRYQPDGSGLTGQSVALRRMLSLPLPEDILAYNAFPLNGTSVRSVASKLREMVSITDFNAVAGAADNTAAFTKALSETNSNDQILFFPPGVWRTAPFAIPAKTKLFGSGQTTTIIRPVSGTSVDFVTSIGEADDVMIENLSIDGGFGSGVTSGDTLRLNGSNPTLRNITITNSPGTALHTTFTASDRFYSILGHFEHITIDKTQHHGWHHEGPNDSYAAHVQIVDTSLGADATYYGMLTEGHGTINGDNFHIWNRSPTGNAPAAALSVSTGGQKFTNSNFEGGVNGTVILNVGCHYNQFSNCSIFAPDGSVALLIGSSFNTYSGLVGGNADFFHPDYLGIVMGTGPSAKVVGNTIDAKDAGCTLGSIDMTNSGGNNIIRIRGYKDVGQSTYTTGGHGAPHPTDDLDIRTDGPAGINYQHRAIDPSSYSFTAAKSWVKTGPLLTQYESYVGATAADGSCIVTLPTAFKNGNYIVTAMNAEIGIPVRYVFSRQFGFPTPTQFLIYVYTESTNAVLVSGAFRMNYIAVGEAP